MQSILVIYMKGIMRADRALTAVGGLDSTAGQSSVNSELEVKTDLAVRNHVTKTSTVTGADPGHEPPAHVITAILSCCPGQQVTGYKEPQTQAWGLS